MTQFMGSLFNSPYLTGFAWIELRVGRWCQDDDCSQSATGQTGDSVQRPVWASVPINCRHWWPTYAHCAVWHFVHGDVINEGIPIKYNRREKLCESFYNNFTCKIFVCNLLTQSNTVRMSIPYIQRCTFTHTCAYVHTCTHIPVFSQMFRKFLTPTSHTWHRLHHIISFSKLNWGLEIWVVDETASIQTPFHHDHSCNILILCLSFLNFQEGNNNSTHFTIVRRR